VSGELEAVIHYIRHDNLVDRSKIDLTIHPDVKTLFPNRSRRRALLRKTSIYPTITHGGGARSPRNIRG